MVKIKVCGLRREEDIYIVNKYKPDYVGFIFAPSKRQVCPQKALDLINLLIPSIKTVGVFLNQSIEKVNFISTYCNLDIVQLHGEENLEYISLIKKDVWKSVSIKDSSSLKLTKKYVNSNIKGLLLDTYHENSKGGTGISFNWNLLKDFKTNNNLILAGGLNSQNISKAIKTINPYCVDVSSGIETNGFKDELKVYEFINEVRTTNTKV